MKLFNLSGESISKKKTLIFDIDGTLYTSDEYVREQVDVQIRHWADLTGMTHEEARKKIADYRADYEIKTGKKISLGNSFPAFGIDIDTSIKWRNTLMTPEKYLKANPELKQALEKSASKFKMICVTNNPVDAAKKTLSVIGIEKILTQIVGLDSCKKSKPSKEMLLMALEKTNSKPEECISIGDRYDIDISLPLEMGMSGVLVNGAEDVVDFLNSLNSPKFEFL